jgi:FAD/FMN-containing dehydrogenase
MSTGSWSHADKVGRIAGALARRESRAPLSLRKRSASHRVPKARDARYSDERIDIGALDQILSIDPEARTCVAESGVTFAALVSATLAHGLCPLVVPELEGITVGGAVSGCSLESTSFKYGGFHDTCLEYELITAKGDVLVCSPQNERRLLFEMLHGTFGTLGVLSKLTFRLMPAKRFVKVTYERHRTLAQFKRAIWRHFRDEDIDFLDGMIHSPRELVLAVGRFVDEAPYVNRYHWTKIYYASTRERREDYLRTRDYFFRYDRGVTNVHPKSFVGRLLLGRFLDSSRLLRLADTFHRFLPAARPDVTLDVFVPFSRADEFLSWHGSTFGHFPVWCVPYRRVRDYAWLSPDFYGALEDPLFLDLAIYGMKQRRGQPNAYRLIETELMRLGGIKTLISHNYYSEDEFWRIWNKPNYDAAKALVDPAGVFRDLYTKTCLSSRGAADG